MARMPRLAVRAAGVEHYHGLLTSVESSLYVRVALAFVIPFFPYDTVWPPVSPRAIQSQSRCYSHVTKRPPDYPRARPRMQRILKATAIAAPGPSIFCDAICAFTAEASPFRLRSA
jgi:hypothetical protein